MFFQFTAVSAFAQQYKYHIVKEGETITSIAREYNTTNETIYKLNPDARNGINPNNKLVVPIGETVRQEETVKFRTHKVKRRETLWRLSQRYGVSEENIKRYNTHLYSEELRRGEEIRIPVNLPDEAREEEKFVTNEPRENPLHLSRREHVVLPKETKFGISRKYNISVGELERLNPTVDTLHPGTVLKISSGEDPRRDPEGEIFQYYLVKPQETLFTLTRTLGISRDSLVVLNPALADGLKAGMVLKIPRMEAIEITPYEEEDIVNLENRITNYETKNLVVMLPFHLDKVRISDTASNAQDRIRRDGVLRLALDFYSGVLMAVDSAKVMGLSTNVRLYDTRQNANEVNMIINTNSFNDVDAVIGPLVQSTAEAAARKLERQRIPVISPLTKSESRNLDNFYQTRPTDERLANAMMSYISENQQGKNLVIIADSAATAVRTRLRGAFPAAGWVDPQQGSYVDPEELKEALVEGQENWVLLESTKIGVVSNATSYLNSLTETYDITLLTTNKNRSFESDNVSNYHLSRLNFHYPSVDREFIEEANNPFVANYMEKYGVVPNTYAVRGFDITYDILLRMATADDLEESVEQEGTTQYVENKFSYEKKPGGGFLNKAIYIVAYDEDLEIKVIR